MFALEFISSQRRVYVGSPGKANKSIYQSSYTEGTVCRETWSAAGITGSALPLSFSRDFCVCRRVGDGTLFSSFSSLFEESGCFRHDTLCADSFWSVSQVVKYLKRDSRGDGMPQGLLGHTESSSKHGQAWLRLFYLFLLSTRKILSPPLLPHSLACVLASMSWPVSPSRLHFFLFPVDVRPIPFKRRRRHFLLGRPLSATGLRFVLDWICFCDFMSGFRGCEPSGLHKLIWVVNWSRTS